MESQSAEHEVKAVTPEDIKKIIEKDNSARVISFDSFMVAYPEMAQWIFPLKDKMIFFSNGKRVFLKFYTEKHEYRVSIRRWIDKEGDGGYLGCTAQNRSPRAGETWTRGNDLPDGKYSEHTWNHILSGIVRFEMVELNIQGKMNGGY